MIASAVESLTAVRSQQPVFVDGKQVSLEAYLINGNNYVKLRDIGQSVGFNVYWDGSAVQMQSDKPYTGEAPAASDARRIFVLLRPCRDGDRPPDAAAELDE